MILAGDIGGTATRLGCFTMVKERLNLVFEGEYRSREHQSLDEIIDAFLRTYGISVERACNAVAGPVRHGRVEASNLPWVLEAAALARELDLDDGAHDGGHY